MDTLLHDLRHAVRSLVRTPGFALVTILTLALGIGANTAIFSIVNGVVLKPLPYPQPDRVVFLSSAFPSLGFDQFWVSPPEYMDFTEMNRSFTVVGAYSLGETNLAAADRPRRVVSSRANAEVFEALGVNPVKGRTFRRDETRVNGPALAILSYGLWQSAFAGRDDIVGRTIDVAGRATEIVGVMPRGFDVMDNEVEVWLPLQLDPANRTNRGSHYLYVVGRLRENVSLAQATAELPSLYARWEEQLPKTHRPAPDSHPIQMEPAQAEIVGTAGNAVWVLQAAVGFVLLIACANLANLLLARAGTRQREFAVRAALGAGRGRLIQLFLAEGVLLSLTGGLLGLGLAVAGLRTMLAAFPNSLPRAAEVGLDTNVLIFTLAVSVATGILFGLSPLLHLAPNSLARSLKEGGDRGATGGRHVLRRALVVAEVGLALMLVVGAGLMLRTLLNLMRVDAGFDRTPLTTFALDLPAATYPDGPSVVRFYDRIMDDLRAMPGVAGVAAMSGLPPAREVDANDTDIEDYTAPPEGPFENVDYYQIVTPGYFETMGIPLVAGRPFVASDITSGPVAVINETMARTFFGDRDAVGRRVRPGGPNLPWFTVVGVAKDVKQGGVDQRTGTELYFIAQQAAAAGFPPRNLNIVVRSSLPATALEPVVERVVGEADSSLPVIRLRPMREVFSESVSRPRLVANLLGAFAGLALLLAALGTHGVLANAVAERRREIGIRMALGAERSSVLWLVLRQGLALAAAGVVLGLVGAFAVNKVMASLLFGVAPSDPATVAGVVAVLALVALVASTVPAWRASRLDPILALREE